MAAGDRAAVAEIIQAVGNFSPSEVQCALELVDIYLRDAAQTDYRIVVAVNADGRPHGYACWGPTPLTRGTYDLYWIATHPNEQGRGIGQALIRFIETKILQEQGRLLIIETSSKESYGNTVGFYRRLGYAEASRIRDFYDVGDDKLVFVKTLSR
jgi:ribosomal protein S18 acetylase RimI-like enzyme